MTSVHTGGKGSGDESLPDHRHEARLTLGLSIEVCGFNASGHFFNERTHTSDVSEGGCRFHLGVPVEKDSVLAIRVIERRGERENDLRPVLFQAAHVERTADGWTVGALKVLSVGLRYLDFLEMRERRDRIP